MFAGIETEQSFAVTMNDGTGRQHIGIETGTARQQAMEHAAMPVGPVHHRGYAETPITQTADFLRFCGHFSHFPICPFCPFLTILSYHNGACRTDHWHNRITKAQRVFDGIYRTNPAKKTAKSLTGKPKLSTV